MEPFFAMGKEIQESVQVRVESRGGGGLSTGIKVEESQAGIEWIKMTGKGARSYKKRRNDKLEAAAVRGHDKAKLRREVGG